MVETLGVVGLLQRAGRNVTTEPEDSRAHVARRKWQRKTEKRRGGTKKTEEKEQWQTPFSLHAHSFNLCEHS